MNADDLFITPSSKDEYVPVIVSSTAETPKLNTAIPTNLVIKGKNALLSCPILGALPITSVTFSELTAISISGLAGCFNCSTNLTSVSFPKLITISGNYALSYAFNECGSVSVSFPELTTISGVGALCYAFNRCESVSVSFPKLTTISGDYALSYAFNGCRSVSVSFPKLTTVTYPNTAFYNAGSSTLTIHLPKALSSLGITNDDGSNSSNYCKFAYDL